MAENKPRRSQGRTLLQAIITRLREYDLDEVVIICNKYRTKRGLPPLAESFVESLRNHHR